MSQYSFSYKKKVGTVLRKLKERTWTWNEDELAVIKFLLDKGLAKFVGVESPPVMMVPLAHMANQMQLQAANHYELSGLGEARVAPIALLSVCREAQEALQGAKA